MIFILNNNDTISIEYKKLQSEMINNMVEVLNLKEDFEIPLKYDKNIIDLLIKVIEDTNKLNLLNFKDVNEILLVSHFLQIHHLYKKCCINVAKRLRFNNAEQVLDKYGITGKDKDEMLDNKDFTLDLYSNRKNNIK